MNLRSLEISISAIQRPSKGTLTGIVSVCIMTLLLLGCKGQISTSAPPMADPTAESALSRVAQIQTRGSLRVGTAITKPFEFYDPDSDDLIGFDVDTAQYIADKLGVKLEWIEMPFANLIPALQDRKVDMTIAAMYIKPEREELVDFSNPYIDTGLVMVVRPNLQDQIQTVDDLAGLKVGVKIGATGAALAQDLIAQGITLESKEFKDTFASFLELEVGRVDVVLNDYLNSLAYIKDTQADLVIVTNTSGEVNFLSQVGLGIAVHQGDHELLELINTALQEMEKSDTFDRLKETWLMPVSNR